MNCKYDLRKVHLSVAGCGPPTHPFPLARPTCLQMYQTVLSRRSIFIVSVTTRLQFRLFKHKSAPITLFVCIYVAICPCPSISPTTAGDYHCCMRRSAIFRDSRKSRQKSGKTRRVLKKIAKNTGKHGIKIRCILNCNT